MAKTILRLKDLKKTFGQGEATVQALRGVDLELEAGAFKSIAGPSGSGKSTLLNIVGGLDLPSSGSVEVDGSNLTAMSGSQLSRLRKERIGFIFQAYNLIPVLTALENAEYVLMLLGKPAGERHKRIRELFETVGLGGLEGRFPRELSGGQQQRVAIVRAIASEPALILADEPTANVDSKTGGELMDLMQALNRDRGATFLFATHDRNVMDRTRAVIHLKDGLIEREEIPGT